MTNQIIEKLKDKYYKVNPHIYGLIILSFVIVMFGVLFFGGEIENVLQSQEKRFGCEDGKIESPINIDLTSIKTTVKIMAGIRTNKVEYPLNKNKIMMEYCFRVANLSSEIGDVWLKVEFLDKDKNALSENEELVEDIPGKRIKTVYGYQIVDAELANEITNISVSRQ
jgi:hypothetical protein